MGDNVGVCVGGEVGCNVGLLVGDREGVSTGIGEESSKTGFKQILPFLGSSGSSRQVHFVENQGISELRSNFTIPNSLPAGLDTDDPEGTLANTSILYSYP